MGRVAGVAITALLAATVLPGVVGPANAALIGPVGAVDPVNGYPISYSDGSVALQQCLTGPQCLVDPAELPNPAGEIQFPGNFPGEFFYFAAEASEGNLRLYEAALEAAFLSVDGEAEVGMQQTFGRLRFRLNNLVAGQLYTIQHPYGVNTFTAAADPVPANAPLGFINQTIDVGCDVTPCDFALTRAAFLGNAVNPTAFLTQTNQAPGMIGDIVTPGTVSGAPSGFNSVIVTGPDAGGAGINTLTVTQFTVQGKLAGAAVAPTAPSAPTATAGTRSATVRWTAPGNGGSPITGYEVRVLNANATTQISLLPATPAIGTSSNSLNVTGLTGGTPVRFSVRATNTIGTSAFSAASTAVIPIAVPNAPTAVSAVAGTRSALVRWTRPAINGSAILGFYVNAVHPTTGDFIGATRYAGAGASSLNVTGLTSGTAVRFKVRARNVAGTSARSAPSNAVTPKSTPGAPVIGSASSGATGAPINATGRWTPPANTGGLAINGYVVTALRFNTLGQLVSLTNSPVQAATARSLTMTLPAGSYKFVVRARNTLGLGGYSARSGPVTAR